MEEIEEFKDDLLKESLRKSRRTLPNKDFENLLMLEIKAEVRLKKEVRGKLLLSLRFFVWALVLGLGFSVSLLFGEALIPSSKILVINLIFILLVVGVVNSGNYRRLMRNYQV